MAEITKIEIQKNRKDRANIYLDGEFFCGTQMYVIIKQHLKEGQTIEQEDLQNLIIESEKNDAMNKVAKLLEKSLKTEKQIREYLTKKGYSYGTIDVVVEKLLEYRYIDDGTYMESFIRSYSSKYGKQKIKAELLQKGIKKDIIEERLKGFESPNMVLFKIADKFMKNKESSLQTLQKLRNHLASKGFSWDEINKVISKYRRGEECWLE